jgi:hypothetical protein
VARTYDDKMRELDEKMGRYDELQQAYEQAALGLDQVSKQNAILQKKMDEYAGKVVWLCDRGGRSGS